MIKSAYLVPNSSISNEEIIKKSRFITYLAHTPGIDACKSFVNQIKADHKDARHNCWAFIAGAPENSTLWRCNDDGEPSGTAGRPMLAQLNGGNVGEITAVVTRYFGGIKLGTGGLARAYASGVKEALGLLSTVEKIPSQQLAINAPFSQVAVVEKLVDEYAGKVMTREYGEYVEFIVELDARSTQEFRAKIVNMSKGAITIKSS